MALNIHSPQRIPHKRSAAVNSRQTTRAIEDDLIPFIERLMEILDTPRSLAVVLLLRSKNDHDQLLQLIAEPSNYLDAASFRKDYLATKLLQKSNLLKVDIDRAAAAYATEAEAERRCTRTNERFAALIETGILADAPPDAYVLFERMRKIMRQVMGEFPCEIPFVGWTPGRSTSAYGSRLSWVDKFRSNPDITVRAIPFGIKLLNSSPTWVQVYLDADGPCSLIAKRDALPIVAGNYAFTVPKSAKTDRFCCYEPHLNVALQRSIGKHLSMRLRRFGINLSDQSFNGKLALEGSKDGSYATLDLSSASDTVASKVVQFLLPEDWFHNLNLLRSHVTVFPDGTHRTNQKFSSMGNGFTFELESAIFYACLRATHESFGSWWDADSSGSVFGDDIICQRHVAEKLKSNLELLGFSINENKTFTTGPFRESCGVDAFGGVLVTPFYIRASQKGQNLVRSFHNRLVEWAAPSDKDDAALLFGLARDIRIKFPDHCGPHGYGDGHFIAPFEEVRPTRASHGLEGFWFKTREPIARLGSEWVYGGITESGKVRKPFLPEHAFLPAILARTFISERSADSTASVERMFDISVYGTKTIRVLCPDWTKIGLLS